MEYTNSPLVNYTKISPNKTVGRNHAIDTITIHCVVGQCHVESLGNIFASPSKQASSNYGIGKDGRIGMYVEEKDRSWCSSSAANDNRAITIEVASDTFAPYKVTDAAYKALLDLVTDICKRNGIKRLVWSTSKSDRVNHKNGCNMTVHRDYANKSCPGDYLYNRHAQIAAEVNKRLSGENAKEENMKRFYKIADLKADANAKKYYLPTVEKLLAMGVGSKGGTGDDTIIDLGEDTVRMLVILDRLGKFDEVIKADGADAKQVIREIADILVKSAE